MKDKQQYSLLPAANGRQVPGSVVPGVTITADAYLAMLENLSAEVTIEKGGFLLGNITNDKSHLLVTHYLTAHHTEASLYHIHFTYRTWNKFDDDKLSEYNKQTLLGWAHSHPGHGVFLSSRDKTVNLFFEYLAVVLDPTRDEIGVFYLKDPQLPLIPFSIKGELPESPRFINYNVIDNLEKKNKP